MIKSIKGEFNSAILSSIISNIIFLILGLFLVLKPETVINFISYGLGTIMLITGLFSLLQYFKNSEESSFFKGTLIYGVIAVIAGIVLFLNPGAVASILPFIIGIWILINSITKVQYALSLRKYKQDSWKKSLVLALVTLAIGVFLIFNPFKGAEIIMQIIGGVVILYTIIDIYNSIVLKKNLNAYMNAAEEIIKDKKELDNKEHKIIEAEEE